MPSPRKAAPARAKSPSRAKSPARGKSPVRTKSPARATSHSDRVGQTNGARKAADLSAASPPAPAPAATGEATSSDSEFRRSVIIYVACVSTLAAGLTAVIRTAPPAPSGGQCDGVSLQLLPKLIPLPDAVHSLGLPTGALGTMETSSASIIKMWRCATAYQQANWWFVLLFFELTYLGLKSFAIPATFAMCVLAGAIFPLPLSQLLTSFGETFGSSMCYALSSVMAKPMLERWAADKLADFRAKALEERDHMFLFNVFLRLSPFPNWLINASSPVVGNPLPHFIAGTFVGTQLSICFLAQGGSVLRTVGEDGFNLQKVLFKSLPVASAMFFLQFIPLYLIRRKKMQKAAALEAQAKPKHKKK